MDILFMKITLGLALALPGDHFIALIFIVLSIMTFIGIGTIIMPVITDIIDFIMVQTGEAIQE
ncbi:hypothetical protein [Fodinibius halophilus]|uniref:hypothetical protein n=1 Tax=Fodinibius halophilus TaxID=1736908 RepID=UPI00197AECE1|nr:hypothetical protein [Fodinibius halophilus]